MKRKIKPGQIWYDSSLDDLILIYDENTVVLDGYYLSPIDGGGIIICSYTHYYNFKDDKWHYIGRL